MKALKTTWPRECPHCEKSTTSPTPTVKLLMAIRPGAGLRKSRFFTVTDAAKKYGVSRIKARKLITDGTKGKMIHAPFGGSVPLYSLTRYGTVVASKWAKVDGSVKKGK